ncbi:MAG: EamA family transporter [Veillonellales bacterium]
MFMYVFSIVLIVASNVVYNICQKSTPQTVNPFASLFITYLTAAALTLVALQFYKTGDGLLQSFKGLNWTSAALGVSIVGLEFGYLMAYRAGWNISVGSLVANIILAIMLIPVGILFYKEGFALNKMLGVVLCLAGLILINKN